MRYAAEGQVAPGFSEPHRSERGKKNPLPIQAVVMRDTPRTLGLRLSPTMASVVISSPAMWRLIVTVTLPKTAQAQKQQKKIEVKAAA